MKYIYLLWTFILDTIAPPHPLVREIERMSVAEFMHRTRRTDTPIQNTSPFVIRALFAYKDPLAQTALLELKSYGNKKMAYILAASLYETLLDKREQKPQSNDSLNPILVPIPMTRICKRKRGWNQCELIGQALTHIDTLSTRGVPRFEVRSDLLHKIRETADQVGKNRHERFENLRNCFAVQHPEKIHGREIIVFDDILTTGATLSEAAQALHKAGASKITCIALAH